MDENIDKLNTIFKSGDIQLGLQLVKSLNLDLYDVMLELFNKYKYVYDEKREEGPITWWVLNGNDPMEMNVYCIRYIEDFGTKYHSWCGVEKSNWYNTLEDCINDFAKALINNYE